MFFKFKDDEMPGIPDLTDYAVSHLQLLSIKCIQQVDNVPISCKNYQKIISAYIVALK